MTILPQICVQWRFSYLFMICTELTFQKGFYVTYKDEHIVNKTSRIKKQLKVLEENVYSHRILPVLAPPYPCHCSSPGNWKGINEIDEFENQQMFSSTPLFCLLGVGRHTESKKICPVLSWYLCSHNRPCMSRPRDATLLRPSIACGRW